MFTLDEIHNIAVELGPVYGPMIRFAAATGMRPEETMHSLSLETWATRPTATARARFHWRQPRNPA
jgi:hypothetical protein